MDVQFDKGGDAQRIAREAGLDVDEVACLRDYSTRHPLPERDMTPDELYNAIEKEIDFIYAQNMHEGI